MRRPFKGSVKRPVQDPAQPREKTVSDGSLDFAVSPDASLPGLPPAAAGAATGAQADNGRGMDGSGDDLGAVERAKAAAARTVAEHLDSKAARRPGKAGTAPGLARPGAMDGDADGGPVEPLEAVDSAGDLADGGEGFEQEFIEAGAELVVDSLNDGAATLMELYALHQLGDVDRAAAAAKKTRMNPRREERMRKAVARLAKKNPERAAKLFGALLYWDPLMWVGDLGKQFKAVGAAGQRLRAGPAPAQLASPTPTIAAVATVTPPAAVAARNGDEPDFKV